MFSLFAKADPIKVGDAAPVLQAVSETGAAVDLGKVYSSQPYTLVYFYPKADTPGCTKQGCSLRDAYATLSADGLAVLGVSADDTASQKAFKEKYHLPFTLLADKDHKVIEAFGVPTYPGVGFAKRQAYLIKGGKVIWADYSAATDKQAEDVLKAIAADKAH
jgi:peroxiredoxin Q/BCP